MFTEDTGHKSIFYKADYEPIVQKYLQYIEKTLIAKTNSIMSLIQLLYAALELSIPFSSGKPGANFYLTLLNRLALLLEK